MAFVVTLGGSTSKTSRSATVLSFFRSSLSTRGIETHDINIRDLPAEDLLHAKFDSVPLNAQISQIARADAVLVATPVYKAAYTGILKAFLDMLPANTLKGKVILPIVSASVPHHMLVLDYALKPVLASLGAESILSGLFLIDSEFETPAEKGVTPIFTPALEEKLTQSFAHFYTALTEHLS